MPWRAGRCSLACRRWRASRWRVVTWSLRARRRALATCASTQWRTTSYRRSFTSRRETADSARVVWDDGNGDQGATPFIDTKGGTARVVVLGLLASHRYALAIEARGSAAVVSDAVSLTTGELPEPIRSLRLRSDHAASSGLTLVAPLLPDISARRHRLSRRLR